MCGRAELFLIAGFLGAGKTTLLRRLLALELTRGRRVHAIVNEFGDMPVDGALLRTPGATMDEIAGGSIFCACRLDRFEAALVRAQAARPDVIFVEASGLSDPSAMRAMLKREGEYPGILYRGCVTLADATRLEKVIDTARPCIKQFAAADLIALTKTDAAPPDQTARARSILAARFPGTPVRDAPHGDLDRACLDGLTPGRMPLEPDARRDLTLQKARLGISPDMTRAQLEACLRLFLEDTHRVKGFARLREGMFYVDCVGARASLEPHEPQEEQDGCLVCLAGAGMALRAGIRNAVHWYAPLIWEITDTPV